MHHILVARGARDAQQFPLVDVSADADGNQRNPAATSPHSLPPGGAHVVRPAVGDDDADITDVRSVTKQWESMLFTKSCIVYNKVQRKALSTAILQIIRRIHIASLNTSIDYFEGSHFLKIFVNMHISQSRGGDILPKSDILSNTDAKKKLTHTLIDGR